MSIFALLLPCGALALQQPLQQPLQPLQPPSRSALPCRSRPAIPARREALLAAGGAALVAAAPLPAFAGIDGSWAEHSGPFEPSFFDDFAVSKASPDFKYKIIAEGTGDRAVNFQAVTMFYTGYLLDGKKFDSNYGLGGKEFKFRIGKGKVISGWEGLALGMREGTKLIALIPPKYAYGEKGIGPIPGGASLVFYMECVKLGSIKGDKPRVPDLNNLEKMS